MKTHTTLVLVSSLVLAAAANAAVITWSSSLLTGATDVRTNTVNETTVLAWTAVTSAPTVNGVPFSNSTTQTISFSSANVGNFGSGTDTSGQLNGVTTIGDSTAYATFLNGSTWTAGAANTSPTRTITLSSLTPDQKYEVRLWAADYRTWGSGRNQTVTSISGVGTGVIDFNDSPDTNGTTSGGGFVIGVFTADSGGSQSFTLTGGGAASNGSQAAQVNAIQVVAIPEPSAALLGGLGMLCLLRRRR